MKKIVAILTVLTVFSVAVSLFSFQQVYHYTLQSNNLYAVDSFKVGESVGTTTYPTITDIDVSSSNTDSLIIVIDNKEAAAKDTAYIVLN